MSVTHDPVETRLDNGTLWIGTDAYPLRTITRVTTAEVTPERRAALRTYAIAATSWLFPATIASAMSPKPVSALITITALTWCTLRTTTLVKYLKTTQHELIIETTTTKHQALASAERKQIEDLALKIMDALR